MNGPISEPFSPRPIQPHGITLLSGWRLKLYSVLYGPAPLDRAVYDAALPQVAGQLPQPPIAPGRFGSGFIIMHQGRGMHYLVLNWWASHNELFSRILVREFSAPAWRPAGDGESACVWDLEIIWFERNAFIESVLARDPPDIEAYLRKSLTVQV